MEEKESYVSDEFYLTGKITFLIPLELRESRKQLDKFLVRNSFKQKEPCLRKMFFEDTFSQKFMKTEIFELKSRPIVQDNQKFVYDISLHIHAEETLMLLIQISFVKEPIDKVTRIIRFKEPKVFEIEDREPINHISVVIEKLMGEDNLIAQIFEKQPTYPYRMIYIESICKGDEEISCRNGTEFLNKFPYLIYGLFHADTHWRDLVVNEKDLRNSFTEDGCDRIINFPNFGWYYGALILISREVLIFYKPRKDQYFKSHFDLTLIPVIESALVREMILIRFESKLSKIVRKKLTLFERVLPFLNYFRLRKIQRETVEYYQGLKSLAEERNFRWFTEIDIFREICFVRYIADIEKDIKQLLEKMENLISNEFMFITQIWLFVIAIFSFIPVIIQLIEWFK